MASRTSKTTFAKIDRERRLQEKRQAKQDRRDARRARAAAESSLASHQADGLPSPEADQTSPPPVSQS